jgi:hypothetical protein
MALLPMPSDWYRARDVLAPIGERARLGERPTEIELLDASLAAYRLGADDVAPLVAWAAV